MCSLLKNCWWPLLAIFSPNDAEKFLYRDVCLALLKWFSYTLGVAWTNSERKQTLAFTLKHPHIQVIEKIYARQVSHNRCNGAVRRCVEKSKYMESTVSLQSPK